MSIRQSITTLQHYNSTSNRRCIINLRPVAVNSTAFKVQSRHLAVSCGITILNVYDTRYFVTCVLACKRQRALYYKTTSDRCQTPTSGKCLTNRGYDYYIISAIFHRIAPSDGQRFDFDPAAGQPASTLLLLVAHCTLLIAHCTLLTLHIAHIAQCAASVSPAVVSRWCVSASCRRRGGGDCGPCCRTAPPACRSLLGRRTGERGLPVRHTPSTGHRLLL